MRYLGDISGTVVPTVVEQTHRGERTDLFSRLLKDRIVFLGTPIDDAVANAEARDYGLVDHVLVRRE